MSMLINKMKLITKVLIIYLNCWSLASQWNYTTIALGTQGGSKKMIDWITMKTQMESDSSAFIHLFVLSFDEPVSVVFSQIEFVEII